MPTLTHVADPELFFHSFSRVIASIACAALALSLTGAPFSSAVADNSLDHVRAVQPEADQSPEDVVQLQLTALGLNQELGDNDGIRIAFRFASPSNKMATGPVDKFIGILQNQAYRPMLDYESVEFAESQTRGDEVGVMVKLTMDNGENAGYVFVLSMQGGNPCRCWMTDRVVRVELDNDTGSSGKSI